MKQFLLILGIICIAFKSDAQSDINSYKYVIVPLSYDFLKGQNTYRLNTYTKHLFNNKGFNVYFDEEQLPDDLFKDRCLAMYADVIPGSGGFRKTKLQLVLKDCYGKVVYTSKEGESGKNNYEKAHHEALSEAFDSFEINNYRYLPKADEAVEEKSDSDEKEASKKHNVSTENNTTEIADIEIITTSNLNPDTEIYYAQAVSYGYQIVDATPKVIMELLRTDSEDIYIVKDKNAIVFKKSGQWIYSENDGERSESKVLNIKF
ncbi:MAG: hypothetical protein HKN40_07270 [Winogradskyella sp.]|uniref:hypothetical protein n=1 Tax=Winogradskyella sp. TaxID=1883156 RepID=UPI0017E9E721|nr:hypothetical protein [Winogradskyella sp.]